MKQFWTVFAAVFLAIAVAAGAGYGIWYQHDEDRQKQERIDRIADALVEIEMGY